MFRSRSLIRWSLLIGSVAFAGLASFPGTAAEARSPDPERIAPALAVASQADLDALLPSTTAVVAERTPEISSGFSYGAYRR